MNNIVTAIILSLLPISELRGGIPFAITQGVDPAVAFFVCVVANCMVIPIVFLFLDLLHKFFMKIKWYENSFNYHLEKARRKLEKSIGANGEFIALLLFVGIPLPMTGAYTGALLAWFFKGNRKKAYLSLALGVLVAAIIVTMTVLGGIKAFDLFIK